MSETITRKPDPLPAWLREAVAAGSASIMLAEMWRDRKELQGRLDRICDLVGERGPDKAFVMIGRIARGKET